MAETTLDETAQGRPRRVRPSCRLLCQAGVVQTALDQELDTGRLVLGRHASCDVVLHDPRVSRRHATLNVAGGGITLEDESRSGTYVGDSRVTRHELKDGDVLVLGQSALVVHLGGAVAPSEPVDGLVGESPLMRRLRRTLREVASSDVGVLVLGETGTGKDTVARALHQLAGREGAYVHVNCGALPNDRAESQLFGHVAGAFTGAEHPAPGLFRAAEGGTLFLDALDELPLDAQPKLLRALESREVTPVGGTHPSPVDARIVAATSRDLRQAVADGRFRADLHAQLSDFVLEMPPLRDRLEDVLLLFASSYGAEPPPLSAGLLRALLGHAWPLNVREVGKIAARLKLEGHVDRLELAPVAAEMAHGRRLVGWVKAQRPTVDGAMAAAPDKKMLEELLGKHRGGVSEVAKALGRSRKQVRRWLTEHGLDPEAFRPE